MSHPYTIDELLAVKQTLANMYNEEHGARLVAEETIAELRLFAMTDRDVIRDLRLRLSRHEGCGSSAERQRSRLARWVGWSPPGFWWRTVACVAVAALSLEAWYAAWLGLVHDAMTAVVLALIVARLAPAPAGNGNEGDT